MKRLAVAVLLVTGCSADPASELAPPWVVFNAPLIPWCVFACQIRTSDGGATVIQPPR